MYKKVFLFFFLVGTLLAQNGGAKTTLQKIFENVKSRKYNNVAALLVYQGKDASKDLKTSYDYSVPAEKKEVDRICKRIRKYLFISDSYEISPTVKFNKNTNRYSVKVKFISGSQAIEVTFFFVKLNGKFLLADIE